METFTFDHELSGRSGRCDTCGAPLPLRDRLWGHIHCRACRKQFVAAADLSDLTGVTPLSDAELDEPFVPLPPPSLPPSSPLPPLHDPAIQELFTPGALAFLSSLDDHPEEYQDHQEQLSLQAAQDRLVRARTEGDLPVEFQLDCRCDLCCRVINETASGTFTVRPVSAGYRCAAHSSARAETIARKWELGGGR